MKWFNLIAMIMIVGMVGCKQAEEGEPIKIESPTSPTSPTSDTNDTGSSSGDSGSGVSITQGTDCSDFPIGSFSTPTTSLEEVSFSADCQANLGNGNKATTETFGASGESAFDTTNSSGSVVECLYRATVITVFGTPNARYTTKLELSCGETRPTDLSSATTYYKKEETCGDFAWSTYSAFFYHNNGNFGNEVVDFNDCSFSHTRPGTLGYSYEGTRTPSIVYNDGTGMNTKRLFVLTTSTGDLYCSIEEVRVDAIYAYCDENDFTDSPHFRQVLPGL